MREIVLASASPRRKQLMKKLGIKFRTVDAGYREGRHKSFKPEELVKFLALGKAKAALKRYPKSIVVGADTLVVYRNHILGKPKNKAQAKKMLTTLSGTAHHVITGLAVIDGRQNKIASLVRKTKVMFRKYSEAEINACVKSGEPMDKAGAYAIQGLGGKLVKKVIGERDSVIGLPVKDLKQILKNLNIPIL